MGLFFNENTIFFWVEMSCCECVDSLTDIEKKCLCDVIESMFFNAIPYHFAD